VFFNIQNTCRLIIPKKNKAQISHHKRLKSGSRKKKRKEIDERKQLEAIS